MQDNFGRVTIPLLIVQATADELTCPTFSKLLYEKASSADKTLKLYDGMYHSLLKRRDRREHAQTVLKGYERGSMRGLRGMDINLIKAASNQHL